MDVFQLSSSPPLGPCFQLPARIATATLRLSSCGCDAARVHLDIGLDLNCWGGLHDRGIRPDLAEDFENRNVEYLHGLRYRL
eukprot:7396316-Pyramimonas_sp.AAC.1